MSFRTGFVRQQLFISFNRDCQNLLNITPDQGGRSNSFQQFEGGVKLGIGSFNLVGLVQVVFHHFVDSASFK